MSLDDLKDSSIIDSKEFDIGYTTAAEEGFVKEALMDEETRLWYPPSSPSDVEIFVRNWVGFARYNCSLTALYEGEVIGVATLFLMPYVKVAHLAMVYIVVKKEYRGKGVGNSLLKNINHLGKTKFRLQSIHMEVFEGAPIESVAKNQGYKEIVRQEGFVELKGKMHARKIYEIDLTGESL